MGDVSPHFVRYYSPCNPVRGVVNLNRRRQSVAVNWWLVERFYIWGLNFSHPPPIFRVPISTTSSSFVLFLIPLTCCCVCGPLFRFQIQPLLFSPLLSSDTGF